jgi:hypothetical protein
LKELTEYLDTCPIRLDESSSADGFRIYHESFVEVMRQVNESDLWRYHKKIADCFKPWLSDPENLTNYYAVHHLVHHAYYADRLARKPISEKYKTLIAWAEAGILLQKVRLTPRDDSFWKDYDICR